ncbi:hypothetical protein [Streptomyces sp. Je 1-332]|uniref:hypothetical protein n=1 Tax=Streptomyces sp. Je 1-332 TaxID=3231270 RepID=UPI0034594770
MLTIAVPPRTRIASLAVRAQNVVNSGLCTHTSGVPDSLATWTSSSTWTAAPITDRRATIAILDDRILCDLEVLSYLRHGTPYTLWAATLAGFAEDVLGTTTWAQLSGLLAASQS